MKVGLRRLHYFKILAETLNFRRTADELNITQPALSRAIAQLEQDVGTKLFERTNRQVSLTLAGHAFAAGCGRVLQDLDDVVDQAVKVAQGYSGYLSIGYTDTVIAGRLPDIVKSFRMAAPEIHVRLIQAYTEQQYGLLDNGQLDIGLMTGPVERDRLCTVDVQSDRFMVVLPADHPLSALPSVCLGDLHDHPFVLGDLDRWRAYNAHLFRHCDRVGLRPRIVQTAPESRAIVGLVACGLGISILPECLMQGIDPRLVARPIEDIHERMITQAGWLADCEQPALKRFIGHLYAAQFS